MVFYRGPIQQTVFLTHRKKLLVYLVYGLPFLATFAYTLYLEIGFETKTSLVTDEDTALKILIL